MDPDDLALVVKEAIVEAGLGAQKTEQIRKQSVKAAAPLEGFPGCLKNHIFWFVDQEAALIIY